MDGNPFNTTVAPSSTPVIPPTPFPFSGAPSPQSVLPRNSSEGASAPKSSERGQSKSTSAIKIVGYVLAGVVSFIIVVLAVIFCLSKLQERSERDEVHVRQQWRAPRRSEEPKNNEQSSRQDDRTRKCTSHSTFITNENLFVFLICRSMYNMSFYFNSFTTSFRGTKPRT